ncbi:hypothetical protein CsSME_00049966 [Camellia sinensis var. sinensis]
MKFIMDLRYIVPPSMNILFHLLQLSHGNPNLSLSSSSDHPLMLKMTSLGFFFFLLLLVISIRLPLTVSVSIEPIQLRFGHFNISGIFVVTLMIVSLVFPLSLFWYSYLIFCIFIYISNSPWFHQLLHLLNSYVQTFPTLFIICTTTIATHQQPETAATTGNLETRLPRQSEFELNEIDDGNELSSEHESLVIIYGHA